MSKAISDADSLTQMVESFAQRRTGRERRVCPRFPTPEALMEDFAHRDPTGTLLCRNLAAKGGSVPGRGFEFEPIGDIRALDFSEDGVQVQFECTDPIRISTKQLFFDVEDVRIPVQFKWYQPMPSGFAGGFTFAQGIESSPGLAGFLVKLSDRLIQFVLSDYLPAQSGNREQAGLLAYLSIFYNLRLRFLESVATFSEAKRCVEEYLDPRHFWEVKHIFLEYEGLRSLHTWKLRELDAEDRDQDVLAPFMKPYRDLGESLSGAHPRSVFLENDVFNALINSIVFSDWSVPPPEELIDQVKVPFESFKALKALLPGVFDDPAFRNQFFHYNFLIRSMVLIKERLIDVMSKHADEMGAAVEQPPPAETLLGDGTLEELEKCTVPDCEPVPEISPPEGLPEIPSPILREGSPSRSPYVRIGVVALLLVLGVLAGVMATIRWRGTSPSPVAAPENRPSAGAPAAPSREAETKTADPAPVADLTPAPPVESKEAGQVNPSESSPPPASVVASDAKAGQAPQGGSAMAALHHFEIRAIDKCWLEVTVDHQKTLKMLLHPGQHEQWDVKRRIDLVVGNNPGIQMRWNGREFRTPLQKGGVLRFSLPDPTLTDP